MARTVHSWYLCHLEKYYQKRQATDIITDHNCNSTMDPHMALSNSSTLDVTMAPVAAQDTQMRMTLEASCFSDTNMVSGGCPDPEWHSDINMALGSDQRPGIGMAFNGIGDMDITTALLQ
ncbi:hypothetical protein H671_1g2802 [Cricetulus griseus]|uniref:Uncharacterized protein n=1 Tax=Cricetulus griseus TaxID=10029 RepID=A0A061ILX0_CRIGR|nr:hypothetical protein H671_1g2802 [Cricetulus griseus]